jgi:hypothetical protein
MHASAPILPPPSPQCVCRLLSVFFPFEASRAFSEEVRQSRRLLAKKNGAKGSKKNAVVDDDYEEDEPVKATKGSKAKAAKADAHEAEEEEDYDSQEEDGEECTSPPPPPLHAIYPSLLHWLTQSHRYAHDGDEVDDLESDEEEGVFDVAEGDSVQAKHPSSPPSNAQHDAGVPPVAPSPSSDTPSQDTPHVTAPAQELHDEQYDAAPEPPLPEEEPELIGTPKAPKIALSHEAPLHANSQSLFKSLRGWLFGDDSDEESKSSGVNAHSSNELRNRDAVLAHALRAEGWKQHKEHFTGAAFTGNMDHPDQPDKCGAVDEEAVMCIVMLEAGMFLWTHTLSALPSLETSTATATLT